MADVKAPLKAHLTSDPTLNGILGVDRVYARKIPQHVSGSCITYNMIANDREQGLEEGLIGVANALIQLDLYANNEAHMQQIVTAVRQRMETFRGTISGVIEIMGVIARNELDTTEADINRYRTTLEYSIRYSED